MGGLKPERLESDSRTLLLSGRAEEGWARLSAAFEADPALCAEYAEGEEMPAASKDGPPAERMLRALDAALSRSPRTAALHAWRGALRRRALRYAEAEADLSRAWALGLRTAAVLTWRGEARLQLGRTKEGLADLQAALARPDARPWNRAWLGRAQLTLLGDLSGLANLDAAVRLEPGNALLRAWRGVALHRAGRHEEALKDLRAARNAKAFGAGWVGAWAALTRLAAGDAKGALPELKAAAKRLPRYAPVAFGLARALRATKRLPEWALALDRAAEIDERYVQRLGAFPRAELEAMERDLAAAARSRAAKAAALRWRGRVLTILGRPEEALKDLQLSAQARPASSLALLWLGQALLAAGKPKEALSPLSRAARLRPKSPLPRAERAKALAGLGRLSDAIEDLDAALGLDPRCAPALADRGAFRLLQGDARRAVQDLESACARDRGFVDALVDLSVAYGRLGRRRDSLKSLQQAQAKSRGQAGRRLEAWKAHFPEAAAAANIL